MAGKGSHKTLNSKGLGLRSRRTVQKISVIGNTDSRNLPSGP